MEGDLVMLARSWDFAAEAVAAPVRVVDLQTLGRMVSHLDRDYAMKPLLMDILEQERNEPVKRARELHK